MKQCLHIIVKGRVQGVYFRAFTRKQADKLNLQGFAKNLPNGDVEIVACGETACLEQLVAWCHKGPLLARVDTVIVNQQQLNETLNGFETR